MASDLPPSCDVTTLSTRSANEIISQIGYYQTVTDLLICIDGTLPYCQPIDCEKSSMGTFDALPPELMQMTLNQLDVRSLTRLARTSCRTRSVVAALPAYRIVREHMPNALKALAGARLISAHSVGWIAATLRTSDCTCCGSFGPLLFLPTCERCCYTCLEEDRSLRILAIRTAARCFGFSPDAAYAMPIFFGIPGARQHEVPLISLEHARRLGIEVHGSEQNMQSFVAKTSQRYRVVDWLRAEPPADTSSRDAPEYNAYSGTASIEIPYVMKGGSCQWGLWCRGCELNLFNVRAKYQAHFGHMSLLEVCDAIHQFRRGERRAWSEEGLVVHSRICIGALEILAKAEKASR